MIFSESKNCKLCAARIAIYVSFTVGIAVILCVVGCSTEHYKAEADEDVYQIITGKWKDDFGQMANYKISDAEPNQAEIQAMVPPSGMLSLSEAVAIATQYSRDYQRRKESLYLSALGLTGIRHEYELQWFGTVDATYANNQDEEDITAGATTNLERTFLLGNGIRIGTALAIDWARFLSGDPQTTLGSVLSASIAAPLLGAGAGKVALENLTQAERDVLYDIRSFNRYRKTFVVSLVNAYYRVLQERDRLTIAEASYKRLIESTNQLRMEVEVGQRPQYDLDEAQQQLLRAENSLVSTRRSYEQTLDQFKIRLALPTDANITLDQNELGALEKMGISRPEYTEKEAVEIALARRLDLANRKDQLEDAQRKVVLAAEGLGVQLNLVGNTDVSTKEDVHFMNFQFQEGSYNLGLEADVPLDRLDERNAYRQALISYQQQYRNYNEEIDTIRLDVRQAYRVLKETAESYRIQKVGLELAEKRVEVEELLLEVGQGTVRRLLEAEDALVEAQNAVTTALIDHMIAKLTFYQDVGILQVKPDGMWEQRT